MEDIKILKVEMPSSYDYTDKSVKKINQLIKEQVGEYYIPVVVPNGFQLEIII